jgi:hypothetical protein
MNQVSSDFWLHKYFEAGAVRIIVWAVIFSIISSGLDFYFGKAWLEQLGLRLSFFGGITLFVWQEFDAHNLKTEILTLARQVVKVENKFGDDHFILGIIRRMTDARRAKYESIVKGAALACISLGAIYGWKP